MLRKTTCLALSLIAAASLSGCALFAPRPAPRPRPNHVIIVGIDGLRPADIAPERTPHLDRMQRDGAYTWKLTAKEPHSRLATYTEALGSVNTSILERCRLRGMGAAAIVRTKELTVLDPAAVLARDVSVALDNAESVGTFAAAQWLAQRPACMFLELSAGRDKPEACDAGLGKLFAAIQRAGLAARTTLIVMSAAGPDRCWMIRGPGTRHGHEIAARLSPGSTAAAAAHLLFPVSPGVPSGLFPAAAFRTYSREAKSPKERIVPRGSVRGRVLTPRGKPMPRATVLLVKEEPADGIAEHSSDADDYGEFRFDSIPAGTYDYVFVFDNLPARLPRSLLVARDLTIKRDTTTAPLLNYRRMQGSDKRAPVVPPAERAAAFLTDGQVERLRRIAPAGSAGPLLAADALSGRRVRTSLIREWLVRSAANLHSTLQRTAITGDAVTQMIDLAAAYDVNRASGLLTNTEDRDVRSALKLAAVHLVRAQEPGKLPGGSSGCLALALTAGALRSPSLSKQWLKRADAMFEARLAAVKTRAKENPTAVDHGGLCSMLAYAMVNRALGCGNYLGEDLRQVTELAASCLTPAQRRLSPAAGAAAPAGTLGFLGLAQSAFAGDELGERMRALWDTCNSPVWTPRGNESILATLLTAAAEPRLRPLQQARSERLTGTTAVLTKDWGTPAEWFVNVNGWTIDLHVRAAKLATMTTEPVGGCIESEPKIVRFKSSPACDYVLLAGRMSHQTKSHLAAYRHILFNKFTGYLVVFDEFPAGALTSTRIEAARVNGPGVIQGEQGAPAHVLALATTAAAEPGRAEIRLDSTSSRPSFIVYPPPPGREAAGATLRTWDVTRTGLADDDGTGFGGAHLVLTADRGTEFIRIARTPAHVAGNIEDRMVQGSVAIIRHGPKSADLILIRADWAQTDDLLFKLERGHGYATIHNTGLADGWSGGGRGRQATLWLGEDAPKSLSLTIDGKRRALERAGDRATFRLPAGAHSFRVK
ncbi:MAG: hypothetical protein ABIF82_05805 [Planctomycetota bacterium]